MPRFDGDDPAYLAGYDQGKRDTWKLLGKKYRAALKQANDRTKFVNDALRNPELLRSAMNRDPQIDAAVTTAVVSALLLQSGMKPEDLDEDDGEGTA